MNPLKYNYLNNNTLMVINTKGKIRLLFILFNMKVLQDINYF